MAINRYARIKLPLAGRGPRAGDLTRLELDLPMTEVEIEGETAVRIRQATHEALVALGWTPPVDEIKDAR